MTDVEAVVPPSSAIDCIARLGGLRAQPVFGEVGPAGGGRRIRNVDPSQKMRRSFRGKMRPKEIDRSGLEPPHHLSGTEGSNPVLSSGESCEPRSLDPSRARSLTTAAAWRADAERQFRLPDAFGEGRAEFAAAPREYAVLVRHFNKPRAAALRHK
jgi:hypothetical protein